LADPNSTDALAHRDPRLGEAGEHRVVPGVRRVGAGIHEDPDGHACLPALDDLGHVARVLHEPEPDVDADALVLNQRQHLRAAVGRGGVAQGVGCACR
jgi:hypothetical protein